MISYHGTSSATATTISAGNVDVTIGGGELGRGFYTGQHLWQAKRWAVGRYDERKANVVEFVIPDSDVQKLKLEIIDGATATLKRSQIRESGVTRSYLFSCDMVWSPIVGTESIIGEQHKWESSNSELLLNGSTVTRKVI